MRLLTHVAFGVATGLLALCLAAPVSAQESKSASLAKQLAAALDAAKLDSVAATDPIASDAFAAALYFPGTELLVVSGKYSAPQLLTTRISNKDYREVYLDLNGAATEKIFIEDSGADGLKARREANQPFDQVEIAGKRTMFDGEWKAQKLSEQDYMKAFTTADERYAQILGALLAQLKKSS